MGTPQAGVRDCEWRVASGEWEGWIPFARGGASGFYSAGMQTVLLGRSGVRASRLAYGCWRVLGTWDPAEITPDREASARRAILAAHEAGYTLFDHADIYCQGHAEAVFGKVLRDTPSLRASAVLVTKCGIRRPNDPAGAPYRYDFSAEHIVRSCEASLERLGVECVDVYLLHRPDYLMEPAEVARAFDQLRRAGKVREFGVSNFRPSQLTALQRACPMPLVVNQVEASLAHLEPFEDGTLDQCLAEQITPMAWSPLAGGKLGSGAQRVLPSQEVYRPDAVNRELDAIARKGGATRVQIALAWLLRHPSGCVPVVGSTDPARIREAALSAEATLSREDWYRLLAAARTTPLP